LSAQGADRLVAAAASSARGPLRARPANRLMHVNNRRAGVDVFALLTPEQQMLARELLGAARAEAQRLTRPN
jgi:hypothetical protein